MNASNLLPDHTIIVTGAATGIGQAFALGAAAQGAHVVVADMNPADETMDLIRSAGGHRGGGCVSGSGGACRADRVEPV